MPKQRPNLNQADIDLLKNTFATKADLKNFATKADLKNFVTKDDLKPLKKDITQIKKDINMVIGNFDARLVRVENHLHLSPLSG